MQDRKFDIAFSFFNYGGNGGIATICPPLRRWWADSVKLLKADPRIRDVYDFDLCDTPITLTRNASVQKARAIGADFLVMIDSDQVPDCHLGDPGAKPFLESSLNFALKHWERGPTCIMAPYCGPPPHENVYGFHWCNYANSPSLVDQRLEQYTREHAAILGGIQQAAAGPTGLSLWDMRCFDVLCPPYFYYEYTDKFETEKASTEDVVATRNLALAGSKKLGYNPVFINWDAWAGHLKPKCVEKPRVVHSDTVSARLFGASEIPSRARLCEVGVGAPESAAPVSSGPPGWHEAMGISVSSPNGKSNGHAVKNKSRSQRKR